LKIEGILLEGRFACMEDLEKDGNQTGDYTSGVGIFDILY